MGRRPKDFDELIRILDSEIRLITPTDPESSEPDGDSSSQVQGGQKYYQLTHDYLVHSLRDWLTRKQKETRRGRAELLLADRAGVWNSRPENRQLPSLWQWVGIRSLTQKKNWTPQQRKMMRKATRYRALRGLVAAILVAALSLTGLEIGSRVEEQKRAHHAAGLVGQLLVAKIAQVPDIVAQIESYRLWADPLLKEKNARAQDGTAQKLHTSLALLPVDAGQIQYLYERLLAAEAQEVRVLVKMLAPHKEALLDKLWVVAEQPPQNQERQRLPAAAALARYAPDSDHWVKVQDQVANDLVKVPAVYLAMWMDCFSDVGGKLREPLAGIYRDSQRRETERALATDILADYAAGQPKLLADLVMDSDDKQFGVLFPKLRDHGEHALTLLGAELVKKSSMVEMVGDDAKETLAKRQANAAVALLRMDRPEHVWPLLKHSPDPRARSYLIHGLGPLGADVTAVLERLDNERELSIGRALILSLGEFEDKAWPPGARNGMVKKLRAIYRTADDAGLHGASEWLLRVWKEEPWLQQINEAWAKDKDQREQKLKSIKQQLARGAASALRAGQAQAQWYVNGRGQTMVVIPGPVEFLMGSPPTEDKRDSDELQHSKRISRTFAIAAKAVTVGEYRRFNKGYEFRERYAPTSDCPVVETSWYQAAAFCNWLSEKEGIPPDQWCYETNPQAQVTKLRENYLSRTGYRLPTEAEIEFAIRAGAVTSRYYGESEELLGKYGWFSQNSGGRAWPVGSKKPNDFGLFDMHGNVWCWCQESYKAYPQGKSGQAFEDKEYDLVINSQDSRVLRGGSFNPQAGFVRCANRSTFLPSYHSSNVGFRPARTFTTE